MPKRRITGNLFPATGDGGSAAARALLEGGRATAAGILGAAEGLSRGIIGSKQNKRREAEAAKDRALRVDERKARSGERAADREFRAGGSAKSREATTANIRLREQLTDQREIRALAEKHQRELEGWEGMAQEMESRGVDSTPARQKIKALEQTAGAIASKMVGGGVGALLDATPDRTDSPELKIQRVGVRTAIQFATQDLARIEKMPATTEASRLKKRNLRNKGEDTLRALRAKGGRVENRIEGAKAREEEEEARRVEEAAAKKRSLRAGRLVRFADGLIKNAPHLDEADRLALRGQIRRGIDLGDEFTDNDITSAVSAFAAKREPKKPEPTIAERQASAQTKGDLAGITSVAKEARESRDGIPKPAKPVSKINVDQSARDFIRLMDAGDTALEVAKTKSWEELLHVSLSKKMDSILRDQVFAFGLDKARERVGGSPENVAAFVWDALPEGARTPETQARLMKALGL